MPFSAPTPTVDAKGGLLEIAWTPTSCDVPGWLVVATDDGQFVGTITRGSTLVAAMPTGDHALLAWNPLVESESVPVQYHVVAAHARVCANRKTTMRVDFGAWKGNGPVSTARRCSREWVLVPADSSESPPGHGSDTTSGQQWLLTDGQLALHRELGRRWYYELPSAHRALVTADCSNEPAY